MCIYNYMKSRQKKTPRYRNGKNTKNTKKKKREEKRENIMQTIEMASFVL